MPRSVRDMIFINHYKVEKNALRTKATAAICTVTVTVTGDNNVNTTSYNYIKLQEFISYSLCYGY